MPTASTKFKRRLHGIHTFAIVCGFTIVAAVILVCGVALNHNKGWKMANGGWHMADTLVYEFDTPYDIFQTEVIAAEICRAREYKLRRPKKYKFREDGTISPYDELFKAYADTIGWDWRMLAAVSFVESHFNTNVVSPSGAKGVMQLMPITSAHYGVPDSLLHIPEFGIRAGSLLLKDLERRLRKRGIDEDVVYFTLAGFHAGLGHIYDAITLADSLGFDPTRWHDNVEKCLILKADPKFYNLPYLRLGRYNGKVTSIYIRDVFGYYEAFLSTKEHKNK